MVTDALSSPLPVTGIPMRVYAGPFKGAAPNAAVAMALGVDASHFDFMQFETGYGSTGGRNHAGDERHRQRASRASGRKLTLTLNPRPTSGSSPDGLRCRDTDELPPGHC